MKLVIGVFGGAVQALHPKLLSDSVGVTSLNQKPGRGDLRPWKVPLAVATVPSAQLTIYRMGRDVVSDLNYWLSWGTRVHAVRGFLGDDTTERTYYTGDGIPKWTDNTIALGSVPRPTAWRQLGVPAPTVAPTLTASGGSSANTESRYYVYTYVTDKGEESAPGPVSAEIVCKVDDNVALASIAAPPSGSFTIDRVRVYVTTTGEHGDTEFFFLRELVAGTTTTTDDLRDRGAVLETTDWIMPPSDLKCLTAMWNEIMGGISGNGFRFSPSAVPYAWPIAYEIVPPDSKPVACAVWRQNFLGLTNGNPLLITGTSPDSFDQQNIPGQACIADTGVVAFDHGVAWPCPDGLTYYGDSGTKLLTAGLLTRDDWQALNPTSIVGGIYEGAYVGFYYDTVAGKRRGFLIDPINPQGIFFLDDGYEALYNDDLTDALYVLDGTNVKKWDAGASLMTATYRSKEYVTGYTNFAWAKVTADAYPVTLKVDAGPFASGDLTTLIATNPGVLSAAGDKLRATITVAGETPVRLPAGFTAPEWQVQVETTTPVQAVVLATSAKETA